MFTFAPRIRTRRSGGRWTRILFSLTCASLALANSPRAEMRLLGSINTPGVAYDVAVVGNYALVASGTLGLHVIDVSDPTNPELVGSVDPGNGGAIRVVADATHAYLCMSDLVVLDWSAPSAPVEVGRFDAGWAYGLDIEGNTAYLVDHDRGLTLLDLTVPAHPIQLGLIKPEPSPGSGHQVRVLDTHAYVVGCVGMLNVIDVADAENLSIESLYDTGGCDGVETSPGLVYTTGSRLRVLDVSDPASPVLRGELVVPGQPIALGGSIAYLGANGTGHPGVIRVVDVGYPEAPTTIRAVDLPGFPNGIAVAGSLVYVAASEAGLQIFSREEVPLGVAVGAELTHLRLDIHPNPARDRMTVSFELPAAGPVTVELLDLLGRRLGTESLGTLSAGRHVWDWRAADSFGRALPSGLHFVRVRHAGGAIQGRVSILR